MPATKGSNRQPNRTQLSMVFVAGEGGIEGVWACGWVDESRRPMRGGFTTNNDPNDRTADKSSWLGTMQSRFRRLSSE